MRRAALLLPVLIVVAATARYAPAAAHTPVSRVTFTQDIGPLLQRRCGGCHRPDGFGPMPLQTYAEARDAAKDIREEVQEGRMPPWPAARGFGDYANDRSLSPLEISLITAWTMGATPLGPDLPKADPAPPSRPDLTIAGVRGSQPGRYFFAPALERERWIIGWEFRPENVNAQHAVFSVDSAAPLGSWVPPEGAVRFPPGVAVRLPARALIVADIQHRKVADKSVRAVTGGGALSLYLTDRAGIELQLRQLACGPMETPEPWDVIGVQADAAAAGDSVEVVATRPDGSVEALCLIPRFQPGYRPMLRLRKPVDLPAGSRIDVKSSSEGCGARIEFAARSSGRTTSGRTVIAPGRGPRP